MIAFVFDLDFTLWDAGGTWCDCTNPPYFLEDGHIFDQTGSHIRLYPDVLKILQYLQQSKKNIAVASRTNEPGWARDLLSKFGISHYFDQMEIYPGSKATHLKNISKKLNIPFHEIVFFDDEYRNIEDTGKLGVNPVLVSRGVTFEMVKRFIN
jgi:magnesium-dependent phosphatase 1